LGEEFSLLIFGLIGGFEKAAETEPKLGAFPTHPINSKFSEFI